MLAAEIRVCGFCVPASQHVSSTGDSAPPCDRSPPDRRTGSHPTPRRVPATTSNRQAPDARRRSGPDRHPDGGPGGNQGTESRSEPRTYSAETVPAREEAPAGRRRTRVPPTSPAATQVGGLSMHCRHPRYVWNLACGPQSYYRVAGGTSPLPTSAARFRQLPIHPPTTKDPGAPTNPATGATAGT
jgi:hypothetical protein